MQCSRTAVVARGDMCLFNVQRHRMPWEHAIRASVNFRLGLHVLHDYFVNALPLPMNSTDQVGMCYVNRSFIAHRVSQSHRAVTLLR